jgi:hypothetical protein
MNLILALLAVLCLWKLVKLAYYVLGYLVLRPL